MSRYGTTYYDSGARYDELSSPTSKLKGRLMATNPTPLDDNDLLSLAEDMADGAQTHQAAIGIAQNTETVMRAAILAMRNADAAAGTAKDNRQDAATALQAVDEAARAFLSTARSVLVNYLGNRWSASWEPTGWPDQSTAVPLSQEKRMNLCASLKIYLTNVPAHENAPLGVTAAIANTHFTALSDGRDALAQKTADQTAAFTARETAEANLRKRVRGLIGELDTLLADDDPRWHAFGLSMPSDPDTPESVASVTLTPNLPTKVKAEWPRAPRATRYRVFKQVVGVDLEPVNIETVHDREFLLEGLPSGQTVKIYIVAANDAGEASASPTEEIVVP